MRWAEGKAVVVAGAASGIGLAAALLFAREGGSVVAVDVGSGVLDVNVSGTVITFRHAIPHMIERGGEAWSSPPRLLR